MGGNQNFPHDFSHVKNSTERGDFLRFNAYINSYVLWHRTSATLYSAPTVSISPLPTITTAMTHPTRRCGEID